MRTPGGWTLYSRQLRPVSVVDERGRRYDRGEIVVSILTRMVSEGDELEFRTAVAWEDPEAGSRFRELSEADVEDRFPPTSVSLEEDGKIERWDFGPPVEPKQRRRAA